MDFETLARQTEQIAGDKHKAEDKQDKSFSQLKFCSKIVKVYGFKYSGFQKVIFFLTVSTRYSEL